MGTRQTKKPSKVETPTEEEMKRRELIKKRDEHFQKLMTYDIETAIQRKKSV
jgi:hypothetical protein